MTRVAASLVVILTATGAIAKEPCASELCLSDYKSARQSGMCKGPIDDYFAIRCRKHGAFNPHCTYREREKYLNRCESGNTREKRQIMAAYGHLPSKP